MPVTLKKYKEKRNFQTTPEPSGEKDLLSFVVQKHYARSLHYDLRLELKGVLKSWAVPRGISMDPRDKRLAVMVEDHPLDYGKFEGNIPEGNYGAGKVEIWDSGTYYIDPSFNRKRTEKECAAGLAKGHLKFILSGRNLSGTFSLVKLKKPGNNWLVIKHKDSNENSPLKKAVSSKRSAASSISSTVTAPVLKDIPALDTLPQSDMPAFVPPMLARSVSDAFDSDEWLFEIKWDGYRAIAEIKNGAVRIYSRNGKSFNENFPSLVRELQKFPYNVIIDGEITVADERGVSSFQLLQQFLSEDADKRKGDLLYNVFDILYFDNRDLRSLTLLERKRILQQVVTGMKNVKPCTYILGHGKELFRTVSQVGVEGIVAKRTDSRYLSGVRGDDWLKIKSFKRQEAVIGGFTKPRGGRKYFGSLVLGVFDGDVLTFIGHAGGGFDEKNIEWVYHLLEKLKTDVSPFETPPDTNAPVTWVKPELVCEVRFAEWTKDGLMRQPVFVGLRDDKDPREVIREKPVAQSPAGISVRRKVFQVSNPEKVFWPDEGYTKNDLVKYYEAISGIILPYLKDRPETLRRHPDGINGKEFVQRNVARLQPPSSVKTVDITVESEHNMTSLLCQDKETLLYMANLGCIELHPWLSRVGHLENPDHLVLDLDPLEISFDKVRETALACHELLEDIGARNFCKTSGATGMHVYVPLGARYSYYQAEEFARIVVVVVHRRHPDFTSKERDPNRRKGKVYLDYLQNRQAQTVAAPYSLRPLKGAPVAAPLKWEELSKKIDPLDFNIKSIFPRLDKVGDLWNGVDGPGIDMRSCLEKLDKVYKETE